MSSLLLSGDIGRNLSVEAGRTKLLTPTRKALTPIYPLTQVAGAIWALGDPGPGPGSGPVGCPRVLPSRAGIG